VRRKARPRRCGRAATHPCALAAKCTNAKCTSAKCTCAKYVRAAPFTGARMTDSTAPIECNYYDCHRATPAYRFTYPSLFTFHFHYSRFPSRRELCTYVPCACVRHRHVAQTTFSNRCATETVGPLREAGLVERYSNDDILWLNTLGLQPTQPAFWLLGVRYMSSCAVLGVFFLVRSGLACKPCIRRPASSLFSTDLAVFHRPCGSSDNHFPPSAALARRHVRR